MQLILQSFVFSSVRFLFRDSFSEIILLDTSTFSLSCFSSHSNSPILASLFSIILLEISNFWFFSAISFADASFWVHLSFPPVCKASKWISLSISAFSALAFHFSTRSLFFSNSSFNSVFPFSNSAFFSSSFLFVQKHNWENYN